MNPFLERYPGLEELIEEFEHLSLAKEDGDKDAITYFKRQIMLREASDVNTSTTTVALNGDGETRIKKDKHQPYSKANRVII